MTKIGMVEIKQLLKYNSGFKNLFPEYKEEINKFFKCTSCNENASLLRKLSQHTDRIEDYLSGKLTPSASVNRDEFKVINTSIEKIEEELKKIPIGSKVESFARFGTDATIIIRIPR